MPQTTLQSQERDRNAWTYRNQNNQTWAEIATALGFSQESVARAAARRHARRLGLVRPVSLTRSNAGRQAANLRHNVSPQTNPSSGVLPIHLRTFGVEIEFKTARKFDAAQAVANALGVGHIHCFGYHSTRCETCLTTINPTDLYSQWKVERDGSVTQTMGGYEYGGELVSPIMNVANLPQIKLVTQALKQAGATVDRRCGLHIHISVADFNGQERANIVQNWEFQERVIEKFVAKSRINNQYCARMVLGRVNQTVRAFRSGNTIQHINTKMQSLNVLPYETPKKTFEVRLHQGTLSSKKIKTWILLLLAFFHNASANDIHGTDFVAPDLQNVQTRPMLDVLVGKGLMQQRDANYLVQRAEALEGRN